MDLLFQLPRMSRLRTTVSKLLALGGLTVASGSTLAYYRYALLGDNAAECRPRAGSVNNFKDFKDTDTVVSERVQNDWDDNWDHRKPMRKKEDPTMVVVEKDYEPSTIPITPEVPKSTATRHVILVRHGQYEMESHDDVNRVLTALGR